MCNETNDSDIFSIKGNENKNMGIEIQTGCWYLTASGTLKR